MKKMTAFMLISLTLHAASVHADTVVEEVPDTLPGEGFGGFSGFMAGAAAGGPIGALVGAGVGWLGGRAIQGGSGLEGTAYRVKRGDGSEKIVRSPKRRFSPGDRVQIVSSRLVADSEGNTEPALASSGNPPVQPTR